MDASDDVVDEEVDELGLLVDVAVAVAATLRLEMTLAAEEKTDSTDVAKAALELLRLAIIDAASLKIWSTFDSRAAELVGFAVSETAAICGV